MAINDLQFSSRHYGCGLGVGVGSDVGSGVGVGVAATVGVGVDSAVDAGVGVCGVGVVVARGFGDGSGVGVADSVGEGVGVCSGCLAGSSPSGVGGSGLAAEVVSAKVTATPSGGASLPVRRTDQTPASGERRE